MTDDKVFEIVRQKFTQDDFPNHVLQEAKKVGNLDNPAVVKTISFKDKKGYIPMIETVVNDAGEHEAIIKFKCGNFEKHCINITIPEGARIDMKSDGEAQLTVANNADNIMSFLQDAAVETTASSMDKQIANALTTSPQEGTEIKIGISNFLESFAEARSKVAPYKLTAIAMTPETFYHVFSTTELQKLVRYKDGIFTLVPDIPIILSKNIALNKGKEGRILFVSNEVPAAIKVDGDIKTNHSLNGLDALFRYNFLCSVESNIKQIEGKNQGVVSIDVKW